MSEQLVEKEFLCLAAISNNIFTCEIITERRYKEYRKAAQSLIGLFYSEFVSTYNYIVLKNGIEAGDQYIRKTCISLFGKE